MVELAHTVRRLVDLVVTNVAPPDVLDTVVAQLRSTADVLAGHVPCPSRSPGSSTPPKDPVHRTPPGSMERAMPYDPVIGRYNPIALPVAISFEPPLAIGTAVFHHPLRRGAGLGPRNRLLGGDLPTSSSPPPTTWPARPAPPSGSPSDSAPTLVGVEARFEAEFVANDGRRVTSKGRLVQDGVVCVEAEGEIRRPRPEADPSGGGAFEAPTPFSRRRR